MPQRRRLLPLLAGLLAWVALASPSAALQDRAKAELFARAQGDDVRVAITLDIAFGWHLYHDDLGPEDAVGLPTVIELQATGVAAWSRPRMPTPHKYDQPVGKNDEPTWIWGHDGLIVVYARGRLEAGATLGAVAAKITGLTCQDDGTCEQYAAELTSSGAGSDALFAKFPEDLVVGASDGAAPARTAVSGEDASPAADGDSIDWASVVYRDYQPRTELERRSLAAWLLFALIAGALLNVMPCVLPVVSIKVLSFVQQAGESRSRVFTLGLAFAAGILAVFVVLAALAAFANQSWGEQFQNETFKIVMIAIVFGFALSLFDVYEIGVPSKVGELAAVRREGLVDAFFKGVMATVLATPCSGPFLGSTLTWAVSQPPAVVFTTFLAVGVGMAAPYVLLTSNPALLRFLPKPGAWMATFKHLMGFVLLATVIFLMMSLRQDLLLYTVAFLIFVALGCWLWGRYATFERSSAQRLGLLVGSATLVALGAWVCFVQFRGFIAGTDSELAWEDFDPDRLERYHAEGRNVFVDFTAEWCFNCKTNEKVVYESDAIVELMREKGVVAIKADLTNDSPKTAAIERLRDRLGARSIPFMAAFPSDDPSRPYTAKDIVTRGQMRAILEALPDAAGR